MKIRPVGAEMFHADGHRERQTDMTKLIVAIRNFAKAPKNVELILDSAVWFRSVLLSELRFMPTGFHPSGFKFCVFCGFSQYFHL
jgi:hypothetical protein